MVPDEGEVQDAGENEGAAVWRFTLLTSSRWRVLRLPTAAIRGGTSDAADLAVAVASELQLGVVPAVLPPACPWS